MEDLQEQYAVPIARYLIFVGGALAGLLFILGWSLPTPPAMFVDQTGIDKTVIRIRSAHKWPEKVVLDTSQPTITPATVEEPLATRSIRPPSDEAGKEANLEAMAQLKPDTQRAAIDHRTLQIKRSALRVARPRRVAKGLITNQPEVTAGGCCQFRWIDNGQAGPNAMSPKRTSTSLPLDAFALAEKNWSTGGFFLKRTR